VGDKGKRVGHEAWDGCIESIAACTWSVTDKSPGTGVAWRLCWPHLLPSPATCRRRGSGDCSGRGPGPRTILDIAVDSWPKTVARHIERADELKIFDLHEMHDLLGRTKGHRGRANVGAALDAYRPQRKFTRSGFERRFLEVVREAGLPEPAMNVFVAGHELDAHWEEAQFGVELDLATDERRLGIRLGIRVCGWRVPDRAGVGRKEAEWQCHLAD
jgi:hypothetical protein